MRIWFIGCENHSVKVTFEADIEKGHPVCLNYGQARMKTALKMVAVIVSLVLCTMLCCNELLWAQKRGGTRGGQPGAKGSGKERVTFAEFDTLPFDITRNHLPPGYLGHDIQLLYNRMKERVPVTDKGESAGAERYGGGREVPLSLDGIYAFQFRPTETFYDAQESLLKVYCEFSTILANGTEDKTKRGFRVRYVPQLDNHYTYTDAKGTKIEFEEVKFRDYTVAFANFGELPVERVMLAGLKQAMEKGPKKGNAGTSDDALEREMVVGSFKMGKAEGDRLKEDIRTLVVCTLVDPYLTSQAVHETGTPVKPREYLARHEYLHVRLLELWFYDFQTGKIVLKITPGQTR